MGCSIFPISQMRTVRLREVKSPSQGLSSWEGQSLKPGLSPREQGAEEEPPRPPALIHSAFLLLPSFHLSSGSASPFPFLLGREGRRDDLPPSTVRGKPPLEERSEFTSPQCPLPTPSSGYPVVLSTSPAPVELSLFSRALRCH